MTKKMKTLKDFLGSPDRPRMDAELRFIDKHAVAEHPDRNGNGDEVFKASNIKTSERYKDRHGYDNDMSQAVYEARERSEALKRAQANLIALRNKKTVKKTPVVKEPTIRKLNPASKAVHKAINDEVGGKFMHYHDEPKHVTINLPDGRKTGGLKFSSSHEYNLKRDLGFDDNTIKNMYGGSKTAHETHNLILYKHPEHGFVVQHRKLNEATEDSRDEFYEDIEQLDESLKRYINNDSHYNLYSGNKLIARVIKNDRNTYNVGINKGFKSPFVPIAKTKEDADKLAKKHFDETGFHHDETDRDLDIKLGKKHKPLSGYSPNTKSNFKARQNISLNGGPGSARFFEDVEQLDELSKKKLETYQEKSFTSNARRWRGPKGNKTAKYHMMAGDKINKGFSKIHATEDVELEETYSIKSLGHEKTALTKAGKTIKTFTGPNAPVEARLHLSKLVKEEVNLPKLPAKFSKEDIISVTLDKFLPESEQLSFEDRFMQKISHLSESHKELMVNLYVKLDETNQHHFMTMLREPDHIPSLLDFALEMKEV